MSSTTTLLSRNRDFASDFAAGDLPFLPKLRTVVLTCGDSRVDPAHILGLELGDAVVIRNNGARVTPEVVHEIATLAFIVAKLDGAERGPFELVIVQHTQCGAERFADPDVQRALKDAGAEIFVGDLFDFRDLRKALKGVKRAYHCPPFAANVLNGAMLFALAAEEAKLEVVALNRAPVFLGRFRAGFRCFGEEGGWPTWMHSMETSPAIRHSGSKAM